MLIAEMLAIHFCSDRSECEGVLADLLAEVTTRAARGAGVAPAGEVRVFWVNPVADLRAMNLLESCGGRLCGSDFMFSHALDQLDATLDPMEALARAAVADPMAGSAADRADRIVRDIQRFGAQAVVVSRIPGASHCAFESQVIADRVRELGLPVAQIEVPPISDAIAPALATRIGAMIEATRQRT
jgi:hypothetical protein